MRVLPSLRAIGEAIHFIKRIGLPRSLRSLAMTLLAIAFAMNLTACGNKGKLRTPTQMKMDAEKKARKDAKKQRDDEASQEEPALQNPLVREEDGAARAPDAPLQEAVPGKGNN